MWPMLLSLCLALSGKPPRKALPRRRPAFRRPLLEALEDRTMPSTLVVMNNGDGSAGSLRSAIIQANTDAAAGTSDTINFNSSLAGTTIVLTQGQLELSGAGTGKITIDARSLSTPITISGNNSSRIFQVDYGVQAELDALTITRGMVSGSNDGGAIFSDGTLTLNNSTLSNNSAPLGGAIFSDGTLTLNNSTVANNFANYNGGGVNNYGQLTLISSTISGNTAGNATSTNTNGGGIFNAGALTISTCTITGNTAANGGGVESISVLTVNSSTLTTNRAYNNGGGIDHQLSSALTVVNSTIFANLANYGAGISFNATNTPFGTPPARSVLTNDTITDNTCGISASGGHGGGGGLYTLPSSVGTLTLNNTIVAENRNDIIASDNITGAVNPASAYNLIDSGYSGGLLNGVNYNQVGTLINVGFAGGNSDGPTVTFALAPSSAAIEAGSTALAVDASGRPLLYDQRGPGFPRTHDGTVEIGAFELQPITTASLQQVLSPTNPVTIQTYTSIDANNVVAAVNGLPAQAAPVQVTLNLSGGTFADIQPHPSAGVTLVINGNGTTTTIVGHSPALTVSSGNVIVSNVILATGTDSPTILVTGGSLTLRNDTIQESTGGTDAAISITGGTLDLGTAASPGGNVLNINGTGRFIDNATGNSIPRVGDTFEVNGNVVSSPLLTVNNLAVSGSNGAVVSNSGTWFDPTAGATVTLTASAGTVTQNSNGTWSWSETTPSGAPQTAPVTIYATDSLGARAATDFWLNVGNVFLVTNTGDNGGVNPTSGAGTGTLRQAIVDANNASTTAGPNLIAFNIASAGMQTITVASALPTIMHPMVIDGGTEAGWVPNSLPLKGEAPGAQCYNAVFTITLDGTNASFDGLTIAAGGSTVQGLVIQNFANDIHLKTNGNDLIQGNFFTKAAGNPGGAIFVDNVPNNTIGGATPAARNLMGADSAIQGSAATGNLVEGNYIGTDGIQTLGAINRAIQIIGASYNTVGGIVLDAQGNNLAGNVISTYGLAAITIAGTGQPANNNVVQGNYIGINAAGTAAITDAANAGHVSGFGVWIIGSPATAANNTIGGTTAAARNVISGWNEQVLFQDGSLAGNLVTGNIVEGNYIGTNAAGNAGLVGPGQTLPTGVELISNGGSTPQGNIIGGTAPGSGNLISGLYDGNPQDTNGPQGAAIAISGTGNRVQGNLIGTDWTGTQSIPNGSVGGVAVGLTGINNVISGNTIAFSSGNSVAINFTGSGFQILGNSIYQNTGGGIVYGGGLGPQGGTGNQINGNSIYQNSGPGVTVLGGLGATTGNQIDGNSIYGNAGPGVSIGGGAPYTTGFSIEGNSTYGNSGLGIDLNVDGVTLNTPGGPHAGPNNLQNFPVLTSASTSANGTTVSGTLNSVASTSFRIEFFASAAPDPSGYGQGQTYLGFVNVTTDASGNASFTASGLAAVPAGQGFITATATNLTTGDTSEFAQDLPMAHITNATVLSTTSNSTTVDLTLTASDTTPGDLSAGFTYRITWGDGSAVQTVSPTPYNGAASVSHAYLGAGTFVAQVTVQDREGGTSPAATALVVARTASGDAVTLNDPALSSGQPPGAVWATVNGTTTTYQPTDQVVISGQGGSDTFTVNFGQLPLPVTVSGGGAAAGDTLIANGVPSSTTNSITKTPGQITWGNPVSETIYRANIQNVTINANGTGQNYVNDPGSNTVINGGPGTNTITITATTGNGVVINGGPHANNYVITMGNLLGPVTINSTAGTSTVTVNGPPGSNKLTLSSTQLTGAGQTINFNLGSTATSFTVSGGNGNNNQLVVQGTPPGPLTAQNLAPTVGAIGAPLAPTAVNVAITASAGFTNVDGNTQTAVWNWGDSTTSPGSVSQTGTTGTVTGSHSYSTDGVFTITLTVTDSKGGGATTSTFQYEVIYNPSAGFVTGGGWITSPAGAYPANPTLTGQANFGLNAKYHNGDTVPSGNTEFQFPAANLNFHATSYDWLVITTNQAQYQGSGTINGAGNYGFLVTALDGGGQGADKFRLKIWDKNHNNAVVYDTQPGAPTTAAPTTALGGGRIQVHTNAQLVAGGANPSGEKVTPLTLEELQPVVQEAIARWAAAGIDTGQLSALSQVTVGIAAFPDPWLGMAFPGAIWIDQTAAGYGWYLDPNPADDSAFPAAPGSLAYGKVDLLTVVEHELGHELGFEDTTGDGLMGVFLPTGVRRVPALDQAPGKSPDEGFAPPASSPPLATLPVREGVVGSDVLAALLETPLDKGGTVSTVTFGPPAEAPVLLSLAPILLTVENNSVDGAASTSSRQREANLVWALDAVFASNQDLLLPELA
jgi:predicted outer membrane repeat protein